MNDNPDKSPQKTSKPGGPWKWYLLFISMIVLIDLFGVLLAWLLPLFHR